MNDCGRREHGEMRLLWPELRKLEIYRMQDAEIIIPENWLHSDQVCLRENKTLDGILTISVNFMSSWAFTMKKISFRCDLGAPGNKTELLPRGRK